jgi:TolB protein
VSRRRVLTSAALSLGGLTAAGCTLAAPPTAGGPPEPAPPPAEGGAASGAEATAAPAGPPTAGAARSFAVLPVGQRLPGRLLFVSDANVWLLERGRASRLTPDRISRQPSWSRDGTSIAHVKLATSGSDLWLMDAAGADSQELTNNENLDDTQQQFVLRPIWVPDGDRLLYLSREGSRDLQVWQLTIATRQRKRFLPLAGDGAGGLDSPALSPGGDALALTSFQPGRGSAGLPQVWAYPLAAGVAGAAGPPRQLTTAPDGAYEPAWSPDGGRLAYTVRDAGRHDVWVMQADGTGARQLTSVGVCRAPAWSPDGAWIAYLSAATGTFELWAVPAPAESGAPPASTGVQQVTRGALVEATSGVAWAPSP